RSSISLTCWAGSTLAGPTIEASILNSAPAFLTPDSRALNQGMPAILTTTTMVGSAAKANRAGKPAAAAMAVAPISFSVWRLFIAHSLFAGLFGLLLRGRKSRRHGVV